MKFSIEEAIRFGWKTTTSNFGFLVKVIVSIALIYIVTGIIRDSFKDMSALNSLLSVLFWILHIVLDIGLIKIALKFASNQKPILEDLYNHYPLFWKYLGGAILTFLIVFGGFILLIIPGIIFGIRLHFVSYLIIDKGLGPIEAIKTSWKITKGNVWNLFLFGLALMGINILGALALVIGLLWTIPTSSIASASVYKKLVK